MKKQRDKVPSKLPAFLNALLFFMYSITVVCRFAFEPLRNKFD